jgi:Uma2 family endonuclease
VLLAPDIAFVRTERLPSPGEQLGFLELAPDIAIEIISPWDRPSRITEKVLEYLRAGVAEVWLIDPEERTLAVHRPDLTVRTFGGDDEFAGSEVLAGFRLPLGELFD